MSRFRHAYRDALKRAGVSISDASAIAGIPQSSLSRFISGDRVVHADHVAALIRALPETTDQERCVLAFLHDQCPARFEERLVVHFGDPEPRRAFPKGDDLDEAVNAIRRAAADGNIYARKVVINLARAVDPDPPDSNSRPSGGGPADTLSKSA